MNRTVGVILAGGQARRMGGGDKPLLVVGGRTILGHVIARLAPQVSALALNANGDPARFNAPGFPILPDTVPGQPGPLAGILAGLAWARQHGATWLVSAPGDCPFLPDDLVARLHAARAETGLQFACTASDGRTHPVIGLWPVTCQDALAAALADGRRKIDAVATPAATATWSTTPIDPFFNVNTPDDLARARAAITPPSSTAPHAAATPAHPQD